VTYVGGLSRLSSFRFAPLADLYLETDWWFRYFTEIDTQSISGASCLPNPATHGKGALVVARYLNGTHNGAYASRLSAGGG